MKIRPLTVDEVGFVVTTEHEDIPVRGNYVCTEDPEADKRAEDAVISALDRGVAAAWCCIIVTAVWREFRGRDTLGCVSFTTEHLLQHELQEQLDQMVEAHGMKQNALEDLNSTIQSIAGHLQLLNAPPVVFITSFCNDVHSTLTGLPINHKCYTLSPLALRLEWEGDLEGAKRLMDDHAALGRRSRAEGNENGS